MNKNTNVEKKGFNNVIFGFIVILPQGISDQSDYI